MKRGDGDYENRGIPVRLGSDSHFSNKIKSPITIKSNKITRMEHEKRETIGLKQHYEVMQCSTRYIADLQINYDC